MENFLRCWFGRLAGAVILTLSLASFAQAQNLSLEQVLDGLASRYQGLTSFQASYSRLSVSPATEHLYKTTSSQTAIGLLSWLKPDKLLLDQKQPQPEVMVTDGRSVWWYIPSEALVYFYQDQDVAGHLKPLLTFLTGLDSLTAHFETQLAPADKERPNQYGLLLTPLAPGQDALDRLVIWCDRSFELTGFKILGVTGESADFYLSGLMENAKVNAGLFDFNIPAGVTVIEPSQE